MTIVDIGLGKTQQALFFTNALFCIINIIIKSVKDRSQVHPFTFRLKCFELNAKETRAYIPLCSFFGKPEYITFAFIHNRSCINFRRQVFVAKTAFEYTLNQGFNHLSFMLLRLFARCFDANLCVSVITATSCTKQFDHN